MKKRFATTDHDKAAAGRPRDAQTGRRILDAALELGLELGFDGLTVEGVAKRAGVGKMTIYRRWPDIWAVVVDAVLDEVTRTAPVQQRATARESFKISMRLVAKSFRGHHGKILRPLIGRAQIDETLRKTLADRWLVARRKISREIVLRGIASGDPFTFDVNGFKSLLLKEIGVMAVWPDLVYLSLFAIVALGIATPLFKRTL